MECGRHTSIQWLLALIISFIGVMGVLTNLRASAAAPNSGPQQPAVSATDFLYRFDSTAQTFVTIPLPAGATPLDVEVTGTLPTHVWFTEFGRNQIGQVIFTNTSDYRLVEYPTNGGPYRLTIAGNDVWFTERYANRIGRLNTGTGDLDEFYDNGLSSNSGLADIKVAPNGWVWVTGQSSNQLIRLVVTSTNQYAFNAYTHTLLIAPYGLAIEASDTIWLTTPDAHRIGQFAPSCGVFVWPYSLPGSQPTEIVVADTDTAWFSDHRLNQIGQVQVGTTPVVSLYGPIDRPVDLARESPNVFWMTQQNRQGALGRLVYTSPTSTRLDSYPFPTLGVFPTGIAVASDNGVWSAAYVPVRVYLPAVLRN